MGEGKKLAVDVILTQYREIYEEGRMNKRSAHQFMFFLWITAGAILGYGLTSDTPIIIILIPLILTYGISVILHAYLDFRTRIHSRLNKLQDKLMAVMGDEFNKKDLFVSLKFRAKKEDNVFIYLGAISTALFYFASMYIGYIVFIDECATYFSGVSPIVIKTILIGLFSLFLLLNSIGIIRLVKAGK